MPYDTREPRNDQSRNRRRGQPAQNTAIADEDSERLIIGHCLATVRTFWEYCDRLTVEHFYTPRNAQVWAAMLKCAAKQKKPTISMVQLYLPSDTQEATSHEAYLSIMKDSVVRGEPGDLATAVENVISLSEKRALIEALEAQLVRVRTAEFGTPSEELMAESVAAVTSAVSRQGGGDRYMRTYAEVAQDLVNDINEDMRAGDDGRLRGLTVGLRSVEEVIGPLLKQKVIILAGPSGGGKTALCKGIMEAASEDAKEKGEGWGYMASLEMSGREHAARSMAQNLGLESYKLERSQVNRDEYERLATDGVRHMAKYPIIIDRTPRMTLDSIRANMIKVKHERGLAFGVIDHLLLIRFGKRESLSERVMEAVIEAKQWSVELDIPIILLSQVKEDQVLLRPSLRPIAADLFGGQTIQQNADVTAFIWRKEQLLRRKGPKSGGQDDISRWETELDKLKNKAEIYNDKGRGHGDGISRDLIFDGPTISFREV